MNRTLECSVGDTVTRETMKESIEEVKAQVNPRRPILGRRATCQYYSPALVLSRNDEKRLKVVLELLETEERYLSCLHTLKSVFEDKLCSSFIIPIKDIETIFPVEFKELRDIHDCMYDVLKKRVLQWNDRSTVGDIFVDFFSDNNQFDLLGLYSSYSNNFPKAIHAINRCVKIYCEFENFLQRPSNGVTCQGLDLQALLLNPIQRLPRYLLLLKQLIKFTDVNHPDCVHVEQALVTMSNTVTVLNNSIQSSLKLATTTKRARRRPLNCQKDTIKVCHRTPEQANVKESDSVGTGHAQLGRPASVCSSVSSGYASDEGEKSSNTCTHESTCCARQNAEFTRLVQEIRQESALEQLAQQKFDFSVSCISPTLRRLQIMRLQNVTEKEDDTDKDFHLTPRRKYGVAFRNDETMDLSSLEDNENKTDLNTNEITKQSDHLETECNKIIVDKENQQIKQLNDRLLGIRPRVHRSYSEGVPIGLQMKDLASYDSELSTPAATPCISNNLSSFQRFSKDRRSWAPGCSLSREYQDNQFSRSCGNRSSFRKSLHADLFEEDSVSVMSDLSTLSGESSVSAMSTVSVPVHGKHASKKRYHKLRDLFKQFRPKQRGNTMPTIPQNDVINIERRLIIPRMMISTV